MVGGKFKLAVCDWHPNVSARPCCEAQDDNSQILCLKSKGWTRTYNRNGPKTFRCPQCHADSLRGWPIPNRPDPPDYCVRHRQSDDAWWNGLQAAPPVPGAPGPAAPGLPAPASTAVPAAAAPNVAGSAADARAEQARVTRLEEQVARLNETIRELQAQVADLTGQVSSLEARLEQAEQSAGRHRWTQQEWGDWWSRDEGDAQGHAT